MPTTAHIILRTTALFAAIVFFSADAFAIAKSCKGKPRADRTASDAFFQTYLPQYTMGECMVRLKLSIHEGVNTSKAEYELAKEFRYYLYTHKPKAAAHYFEPGADGYHYLMYVNGCPNRYAITQSMIEAVAPCFEGEAKIEMIKTPVEASPKTFEPTTMEWTDSNPE